MLHQCLAILIQIQHLLKLNEKISVLSLLNIKNSNTTLVKVKFTPEHLNMRGFGFKYNTC